MRRYMEDRNNLVGTTNEFGDLVLDMVEQSMYALRDMDVDIAREIIDSYTRVEYLDDLIEEDALRILMLFQPMASDMREVATILKTITYLERIGKYCHNIGKAVIFLKEKKGVCTYDNVSSMGQIAVDMVRIVTDTMKDRDIARFNGMSEKDGEMDALRHKVLDECVDRMRKNPDCVETCTYYISISRFFERIGDHACKAAEKITYMVNGKHVVYN